MSNTVKSVLRQRSCHINTSSPLEPPKGSSFPFLPYPFLSFAVLPFSALSFALTVLERRDMGVVECRGPGSGSSTASEQHADEAGPVPLRPHRHGGRPGGPQPGRQQVQHSCSQMLVSPSCIHPLFALVVQWQGSAALGEFVPAR